MNLKEFSKLNRERCESDQGFKHKLESWDTSDWFLAVMGELGEAANIAKKLNRERDGIPGNTVSPVVLKAQLANEIADTFIYLDLLAQSLGFDLSQIVPETFDEKSKEIGYTKLMLGEPMEFVIHGILVKVAQPLESSVCQHEIVKSTIDYETVRHCQKCGMIAHADGSFAYCCGAEFCRCCS